jgi:hypothetical protein
VPLLTDFPSADQTMLDAALFGQVEFRPHSRVTANLGVRYDVSFAFKDAAFNPVAESTLGIRTDTPMPVDWNNVLPRAQFTWDVRGDGREILRIGGGAFTANPHHAPFYNSILFNGTQLADINVTGALVPRPDYASYRADPTTIPGVPTGVTAAPAQVELIGKDYQLPFTWKANLAYSRTLFNRLTLGANAVWSRTSNNYQIFNRNLVAQPFFTIEGGRPVFVPAASIPTTGVVNAINNRVTQQVAEVFELTSQGRAEQKGIVLEAGLRLPRRSSINASLTFSDAARYRDGVGHVALECGAEGDHLRHASLDVGLSGERALRGLVRRTVLAAGECRHQWRWRTRQRSGLRLRSEQQRDASGRGNIHAQSAR